MWGILLVAALILGGGAYYWRASQATGGGPLQVSTFTAAVGDVEATIRVNGTIAARERLGILAPRIQGSRTDMNRGGSGRTEMRGGRSSSGSTTVIMMGGGGPQNDFSLVLMKLAKAGATVKKGDIIAEFDPQLQLQRLEDYKDNVVQLDAQIKAALADLAANREENRQSLRSAKADLEKAQWDEKSAPARSDIEKEKLKLATEKMAATYKQLQETDRLIYEQQLSAVRSTQLNREQTRLELKRTEENVEKMKIRSPMDGIVVMGTTTRNGEFATIREGDEVRPGQPFMYIVDPRSMILNASVNQVDAEKLRLGMKGRVRLDAYADIDVPATLEGIGAMSKSSTFRAGFVGEIPVLLALDKMDIRIIPDLTGSAEITLGVERNAVVVPRAAVVEENGGKFVFVRSADSWLKKAVDLGLSSFTAAAVKSGVQKGDVVALQRPM